MARPVILVDLDNVVYDWVNSMAVWMFNHGATDGRLPSELMEIYDTWAVWNDWDIPEGEFMRWWRLGIEEEIIYATGLLIPGARSALWRLSDAEWDITIATSRLTKFGLHDKILANTASWLRDNNIPYRNILFTNNKKSIKSDAIVDDRSDNMDTEAHGKTFLFPANHNQDRRVTPREQILAWQHIVDDLLGVN